MNWVKKYYLDKIGEVDDELIIVPFFKNGIEIKDEDSNIRMILYQEPFTNIVASIMIIDDFPIEKGRYYFNKKENYWVTLDN